MLMTNGSSMPAAYPLLVRARRASCAARRACDAALEPAALPGRLQVMLAPPAAPAIDHARR
jgi:hypothetical protein